MTPFDQAKERLRLAKDVPLLGLIRELGYTIDSDGSYYSMLSPFRAEGQGSLKISKRTPDRWRDYGNGKHGDIVDFVQGIFPQFSKREAIDYLLQRQNIPIPTYEPIKKDTNAIEIVTVEALSHPRLCDYLTERKIGLKQAKVYLSQAKIKFPNGKNPERIHTVLAWKNNSGGYEFRNSFLKLGNSPKDVTNINEHWFKPEYGEVVSIFEGFTDFLAYLTLINKSLPQFKSIVLNSASFIRVITPMLKDVQVWNYAHNDQAGNDVHSTLLEAGIDAKDMRYLYPIYNDVNDWLMQKPIKKKTMSIRDVLNK